jgi:signal transduction histidine kinase
MRDAIGSDGGSRGTNRRADERLDRFVSGLSHQLGQCALLIEGGLEAEVEDSDLHDVAMAGAWIGTDRLRRLNHELNDFGRLTGRPPRPERLEPGPLLRRAAVRLAEEATGPWRLDVGDLPPVIADPAHVEALWVDLLRHAVAAQGEGGGTVRVRGARDGTMAAFDVTDEGRHLTADELAELFDVGTPLRGSGALVGAGLALVGARRLVEANGGGISARSGTSRGVVVTFTLPAG